MSSEQREYSGWLGVRLTPEAAASIRRAAERAGLHVDIAASYLEFEYVGPDSNRFVVAFLREIAPLVGAAQGEIRCEIESDETEDPRFEFYRYESGQLVRQQGRLVRDAPEVVH